VAARLGLARIGSRKVATTVERARGTRTPQVLASKGLLTPRDMNHRIEIGESSPIDAETEKRVKANAGIELAYLDIKAKVLEIGN
jgi:hypothetical protein